MRWVLPGVIRDSTQADRRTGLHVVGERNHHMQHAPTPIGRGNPPPGKVTARCPLGSHSHHDRQRTYHQRADRGAEPASGAAQAANAGLSVHGYRQPARRPVAPAAQVANSAELRTVVQLFADLQLRVNYLLKRLCSKCVLAQHVRSA
jgi:hypothetical protein